MDITISVGQLRAVMARALGVAGTKSGAMPILATVLFEAEQAPGGGVLSAKAYDLEIGVGSRVPCEVRKPGAVAIPAKLLADVVKALPEQVVRLSVGANRKVEVTSGSAVFRLAGLAAEDFPTMPLAPKGAKWAPVQRDALIAALDRVTYAMSSDESRYNLNGVFFDYVNGERLALVATDGHRLATADVWSVISYGLDGAGAIVGRKAVDELRGLLAEEAGDPGELAFAEGSLLYRRTGLAFIARLIDGQFPDWTQVVPKVDPKAPTLTVDRAALRDVLRRVLLLADDRASGVTLALSEGRLVVTARNADSGEARDSLVVEYTGPGLEVTVNGRYLAELAGAESSAQLAAVMTDELSPLVWWPVEGADRAAQHVVMPMRR